MHVIFSTLIQELHAFAKNHQETRVVVGLSGGLDSAVALCVAVRAFGAKNVTALIMPEMGVSPYEEAEHAKVLAEHFECPYFYQPINNFLVDYQFVSWERTKAADETLKPRIRATLLEHFAECTNSMIIGTANKSDLLLGIGTRDGDFIGELHVLGDLYKTDIIDLARYIGLPDQLIQAPFTRGLKPNQIDEVDLSGPWSKIDDILRQLEDKVDPDQLIEKGMDALLVHKVVRLVQQNEVLLKNIPIIRVGRVTESIKKAQAAEASSL